jgi:hypothetical protein
MVSLPEKAVQLRQILRPIGVLNALSRVVTEHLAPEVELIKTPAVQQAIP